MRPPSSQRLCYGMHGLTAGHSKASICLYRMHHPYGKLCSEIYNSESRGRAMRRG
jgi:hypothetical protein